VTGISLSPTAGERVGERGVRQSHIAGLIVALVALSTPAVADKPSPLVESREDVTVDWAEGTLTASGGAAADLRMPSADLARPGAERRARGVAQGRLEKALADLPLGEGRKLSHDEILRAVGRARTVGVDYQSNGGAVVRLQIGFGDWLPAPPPAGPALAVGEVRLGAAPRVKVGKQEITVGAARYRIGHAPADAAAIAAKIDRQGQLTAANATGASEKLAGAAIVIYVRKVLP